jgi:hypothetical protein
MARFQQKILDPLTRDANSKLDQALAVGDITERADALVTARDDGEASFKKAINGQKLRVAGAAVAGTIGAAAAAFGFWTATSLLAVLAGTTGAAIPFALAGLALAGASIVVGASSGSNIGKLTETWKSFSKKADSAISSLVTAHPEEAQKSSKLSAFLKRVFNPAASDKPAAQAAPAAPAPRAQPAPTP